MTIKNKNGKEFLRDLPNEGDVKKAVDKTLDNLGKAAVKAFQDEVRRSSWNKSPQNLIDSFQYEIVNGKVRVYSDHPAATYLNKGVKPHQMIYMTKAKKPIPIITDTGEVIFRTPSSKSMSDGSWKHPGISGKHFMERGKEKAEQAVKEQLVETYKDMLRKAFKG